MFGFASTLLATWEAIAVYVLPFSNTVNGLGLAANFLLPGPSA
jgi:hypothetical protein